MPQITELKTTPIRTFAATAAEAAGLPAAALFQAVGGNLADSGGAPGTPAPRLVDFIFDTLVFGGTANATAVTFYIYGKVKAADGVTDVIFKRDQITLQAGDLADNPTVQLLMSTPYVWVKLASFIGGTAPVLTSGAVRARAI